MELDQDSLPSQPKANGDDSTVKLFGEARWGQKKRRAHQEDGEVNHEPSMLMSCELFF